jgi:hypothetical protein
MLEEKEKPVYSETELAEMQKKTMTYYANQESLLAQQCVVEELRSRIKKAQYEAYEWNLKLIHLQLSVQEPETKSKKKSNG